ncbi:hypothetical protein CDLVIII_3839 [Clostridium sp. DL-VIII]|uniref:helicase-associated domain-containing protein n=1 Tax=Clostridium sp. DL-VIII TaxID=641107 RepID=UPI00023AFFEE|nr:helicase-associated domain-containing protein [Clostridium sp. DL-VIII]EHJ00385.1 hypothetical protein CDLVIII_3839 [Clostridium sp. DL-VIII]
MALREQLESMTTSGYGMNLPQYVKISGVKALSTRKAGMVDALYNYLSNKDNIIAIWNSISQMEKEIISEYIRSEGKLENKEVKEIMKKYTPNGTNQDNYRYSSGIQQYFYNTSKANLFFINGRLPIEITTILKSFIKPIEVEFFATYINTQEYLKNETRYDNREFISIRETFEKDFVSIIKLVNSSKFKTTKASQMPNKTAMVKMNEVLTNKEIFYGNDISQIRVIDNTTRLYGISKLLLESGILEIQNETLVLGNCADDFLMMKTVEKCKFLLEAYIKSGVDELRRINELKIKTDYNGNYSTCREVVLKYLKMAPIDEWIEKEQLLKFIKKLDRNFLRKIVGTIYTYYEYDHYYYPDQNSWEEEEGRFIDVVLMEYLASMGIVDLLISDDYNDEDVEYLKVDYFKLTQLGAHVLGVNDDYKIKHVEDETGIIIQPNYEIIVQSGTMKDVHCIYLDKFAEKLSEDTVSIYKISFKAMVTALDNGISIEEISDYFKEFSQNKIPDNVLLSLNEWKDKSKKIKIRKVTIVETDDKYLLEELKNYKEIKKDTLSELPYAFEIDSKAANKVKRNIEKKNHFCIIE